MNRKPIFTVLYLYALLFSVLKAIRFPNDWAEAHWMMDYRFGFIKRGLAGEVLSFFIVKDQSSILWFSVAILALLYIVLFAIAIKQTSDNGKDVYTGMFYLIFFLSQYIVYSAHLIGYLDHIIFLLTIAVVHLIRRKKILMPLLLMTIAIAIHEISFFLMLPVALFALIVSEVKGYHQKTEVRLSPIFLKKLIIFLMIPLILVAGISIYQEIYGRDHYSLIFGYLKNNGFISERAAGSVASAYTEKLSYYWSEERVHLFQRLFFSTCTIWYGIPLIFLLFIVYRKFYEKTGLYLFLIFVGIVVFPLLLNAIAWDTYRIWTFPYMILFLGFWILSPAWKSAKEDRVVRIPEAVKAAFVISVLLVALGPNYLMDGETEQFSLAERTIILIPLLLAVGYQYKSLNKNISRPL